MITIAYINFWTDPFNDRYLSEFIKENIDNDIKEVKPNQNPDILIASVNGNINLIKNIKARCKIFFYGENLNHYPPYNNINLLQETFDIILGFKYTNKLHKILRFPLWLIYYKYYNFKTDDNIINFIEEEHKKNISINKKIFGTLISRHDRGGQRKIILQALEKYNRVACPGKFRNNTQLIGPSHNEKKQYISRSIYNICPENSIYEGYTTEKIFQALEAGTIPLYWGHDLPEKELININKYCFCPIDNRELLNDKINDVVINKQKYIQGNVFNNNAKIIISGYYNDLIEEIKKFV